MVAEKRNVYQLTQLVAADMARTGIGKDRVNQQQGFKFRGIDQVLNALSPTLAHHGLIVYPRMVGREMSERTTQKGQPLFTVVVEAEFDFVSAEDGSKHTVRTYGEAMDTADKATNKAMSVAYKYAAFLTFCIPLEAMAEDADAVTPEPAPIVPEGYDNNLADLETLAADDFDRARAAFKAWPEAQREYFLTVDTARSQAFKAKGAEWDKAKRAKTEAVA